MRTGEAGPPSLFAPDPNVVTVYRWEDARAASHLEWAWAIANDHGNLQQIETLLADGVDPDRHYGGDYLQLERAMAGESVDRPVEAPP